MTGIDEVTGSSVLLDEVRTGPALAKGSGAGWGDPEWARSLTLLTKETNDSISWISFPCDKNGIGRNTGKIWKSHAIVQIDSYL